jgi:hypothetical protein
MTRHHQRDNNKGQQGDGGSRTVRLGSGQGNRAARFPQIARIADVAVASLTMGTGATGVSGDKEVGVLGRSRFLARRAVLQSQGWLPVTPMCYCQPTGVP